LSEFVKTMKRETEKRIELVKHEGEICVGIDWDTLRENISLPEINEKYKYDDDHENVLKRKITMSTDTTN